MKRFYPVALGLIILFGLILRFIWCSERYVHMPIANPDEYYYYISTGERAYEGLGLYPMFNTGGDGIYVPSPLQPVFIYSIYTLTGKTQRQWPIYAQVLLSGWFIFMLAAVGRKLAGDSGGLVAALFAAFYPQFIFWPAYLMTESNYLVGFATLLYQLLIWCERPTLRNALVGAVLLGLLNLQRLNSAPLGLCLALFALWQFGWRQSWRTALVWVFVPLIVMSPWPIRNLKVYGEPIWGASNAAINFYFGNNAKLDALATPSYMDILPHLKDYFEPEIEKQYRDKKNDHITITYYKYSNLYKEVSYRYIREHPWHFLKNNLYKFSNQFTVHQPGSYSAISWFRQDNASEVLHWFLLLTGLVGLCLMLLDLNSLKTRLLLLLFGFYAATGAICILPDLERYSLCLKIVMMLMSIYGVYLLFAKSSIATKGSP